MTCWDIFAAASLIVLSLQTLCLNEACAAELFMLQDEIFGAASVIVLQSSNYVQLNY